jgi:hypothetical protein
MWIENTERRRSKMWKWHEWLSASTQLNSWLECRSMNFQCNLISQAHEFILKLVSWSELSLVGSRLSFSLILESINLDISPCWACVCCFLKLLLTLLYCYPTFIQYWERCDTAKIGFFLFSFFLSSIHPHRKLNRWKLFFSFTE